MNAQMIPVTRQIAKHFIASTLEKIRMPIVISVVARAVKMAITDVTSSFELLMKIL
jgi:hypothetical protein